MFNGMEGETQVDKYSRSRNARRKERWTRISADMVSEIRGYCDSRRICAEERRDNRENKRDMG